MSAGTRMSYAVEGGNWPGRYEVPEPVTMSSIARIDRAFNALQSGDLDARCPYYGLVPKGFYENLAFRKRILQAARHDKVMQYALWEMCRDDTLFYINTFGWIYETRDKTCPHRPFITWPFQDRAIFAILDAIGDHDLLIEKSRDVGASWIILYCLESEWHFHEAVDLLLVSRNEEYVDKRGNRKSLFAKLDYIHQMQPSWLLPGDRIKGWKDPERTTMHLRNAVTEATIDGEATTGELASGDRRRAIMMDELAKFPVQAGYHAVTATRDVTPCRLYNSTPRGRGNVFYDLTKTEVARVRMHWSDHPIKRRGLYRRTENGELEILDRDYWAALLLKRGYEFSPHELERAAHQVYGFVIDDAELPLRSPWFDAECKRCRSRTEILQELEIRYDAANAPFFATGALEAHRQVYVKPPLAAGELDYFQEELEPDQFLERPHGKLKLWLQLDSSGRPPEDRRYVIGIDVAAGGRDMSGRGASNSVACVVDAELKEQVAEYAISGVGPESFARRVLVLARWFRTQAGLPKLIWESNGPGTTFGTFLIDEGYRNVYYRTDETAIARKPSDRPGWHSGKITRAMLLTTFRDAISEGSSFVVRSDELLNECEAYEYSTDGDIVHSGANAEEDPLGARDNHGDRVIAGALACFLVYKRKVRPEKTTRKIPRNCYYRRQQQARAETQAALDY